MLKCRNFIVIGVWVAFVGQAMWAQDGNVLATDLAKHWQILKNLSLAMAAAIPVSEYASQASPSLDETKKLGSGLNEIAVTNVLVCSLTFGVKAPQRFQSAFDRPMDSTKAGVVANLTGAFDFCLDLLKQSNDLDLFKMAGSGRAYQEGSEFKKADKGHQVTKFDAAWDGYAHSTLLLGMTVAKSRLKGIEVPAVGPKFKF